MNFYRKLNLLAEEKFPRAYGAIYRNRIIVKYSMSGTFAATTDFVCLYLLAEYVFSPRLYPLAVALAFFIAFMLGFFIQKFWTFQDKTTDEMTLQMYLYFLVALVNLVLNLLFIVFLVEIFGVWYFTAQLIAAILLAGVSFILYNRFVFRSTMVVPGSILIAAGIFPPDVGGPATHSLNFLNGFKGQGIKTGVVTYSDVSSSPDIDKGSEVERISRRIPHGLRHFVYFLRILTTALKYDIIYAQDISAAGLPAMTVSKLINRRFFLRIGGDLLWERLAEKGKTKLSVLNFYKTAKYKKYYLYHLGQSVLMRAEKIIVPTELLAEIYAEYYGIDRSKISVISNPVPAIEGTVAELPKPDKTVLFAGRFVKYKNLERLIIAFANIYAEIGPAKLILIGDGPEKRSLVRLVKRLNLRNQIIFKNKIPHDELMREIAGSSVCVAPALTEFNPNFILECLSLRKPAVITKENGLSVRLPDRFLVEATDLRDIENKLKDAISFGGRAPADLAGVLARSSAMSWDGIIREHIKIFAKP